MLVMGVTVAAMASHAPRASRIRREPWESAMGRVSKPVRARGSPEPPRLENHRGDPRPAERCREAHAHQAAAGDRHVERWVVHCPRDSAGADDGLDVGGGLGDSGGQHLVCRLS